jgi:hypothetical protein
MSAIDFNTAKSLPFGEKRHSRKAHLEPPSTESTFYLVHHDFRRGKADTWWSETMDLQLDESKSAELTQAAQDAGFKNHSFNPVSAEGPIFCVWEAKAGIDMEGFQKFLESGIGPSRGAFINIVYKVDPALNGGATPVPRYFQVEEGDQEVNTVKE